jgi:glycosyltransferase involved in cell wall biosynthesis
MKLACVVHRYGADFAGGSEAHCRGIAERLGERHQVDVLTTCARDYVSWRNELPAGVEQDGRVRVHRFQTARTRDLPRFNALSELVFSGRASDADQEEWFRENGPDAPGLLDHLHRHGREYDLILFWSYRYAPTFFGVPIVPDRAVLVPTAEEDVLIRTPILKRFFRLPAGYLMLTPEEAALVSANCQGPLPPAAIVGTGLTPATPPDAGVLASFHLEEPYVLYLGRIERNKGCDVLFHRFAEYAASSRPPVSLVLAGPELMAIPAHPRIRALGFVAPAVREALLSGTRALVMPSPYESLSMALLEAWNHARPALVNGRCNVLLGQVRRANAGLYYETARDFLEGLRVLVERSDVADALGRNGLNYVEDQYRWPQVLGRTESFLAKLAAARTQMPSGSSDRLGAV